VDAQIIGDEAFFFYEFAREDGAHDLRFLKARLDSLPLHVQTDRNHLAGEDAL